MARILIAAAALLAFVSATQEADFRLSGSARQGALLRGTAPPGTVALDMNGREVPLAPGGRFILGFDRDAGPAATLTARLADDSEVRLPVSVTPRAWRIQHVNMARPSTGPSPEYARLREGELARIGAARTQGSDSIGWSQPPIWPVRGRVSGVFGAQRIYRSGVPAAYHSGVDIAAPGGTVVVAPADGVVTLAPPPGFSLEGNLVILDHGMGLSSAFLHLSRASVRAGDRVRQGQEIGRVGATGRATGPHLHWSLVWNGARLDPQAALGD